MQEKIKHLNCRDLSPSSEEPPSPIQDNNNKNMSTISAEVGVTSSDPVPEPWSDDSTNYKLPTTKLKTTPSSSVSCHALNDNSKNVESQSQTKSSRAPVVHNGVLPGSTGSTPHLPTLRDQSSSDFSDLFILPTDYKPGSFPRDLEDYDDAKCSHRINHRTGSFNLGHEVCDVNSNTVVKRRGSMDPKLQAHRHSIYDNVPIEENLEAAQEDLDMILYNLFQDINGLNKTIYGDDAEVLSPPSSIYNTTNSKTEDVDESVDVDDSLNGNDQENDVISGTVSSPDSSDHDIPCEDLSHDDSGDHIVYRERRDSGVGSSLTRAPSDRRRYRIRWHSFQKSHRPSIGSRNLQITSLSVCQLMVLQKLSLCRLTGLIEKYSPNRSNWTWTVPRFMKRHKVPDYSVKNIFGVPLLVTLQRTGQPLPQCILHAMRYLRKTAGDAVGIFRKSGVRSRIQKLKNDVEENAELVNFEELQAYDVADLVKQYFRELPECLLTNKLSEIFFNIFIYVPVEYRVDALQSAIFLLPDENREVLQSLLLFLGDIATHDAEHQMTASNLAVCFAPSLFNMGGMKSATQSPSPRRPRKNLGVPDARELQEQKAAQDCLTTMIKECKQIFMIPVSLMSKCRFSYIEQGDPVSLDEFYKKSLDDEQGYQTYVDNSIQGLLKESREKSRGWISTSVPSAVDVSYKKVADGHPLRLWKCCVDVEAPPEIVLDRIKNERHTWDEDMMNWRTIETLDNQTEIFQYVRNSMAPHPSRDYCVLRCWKTDLAKGACALISTSVEHPKAELLGGIRAVELASHYLIEPCGTGKSRITHMCRLDMRGRTPEWYKKAFGHICANSLERIRDSFKQTTDGPESTV
ncbi:hypothetical protein KUTeg_024546 [Tegillarca granosa]|uniref:StAR-related lipid transfer protein 13 n=1 Tax=Tegillarca granosa TaxID=220873 RepID=A0ABQ9E3D4_TEGGR|nr:hypothetical protein KUTeg_024546 [Tegillarca granosa]